MKTIAVVIASAPGSPNLERARVLACQMEQSGNRVVVCLWQDAVLAAVNGKSEGTSGETWVLEEDLTLRGFGPGDMVPGARPVGYEALLDLWMSRCDAVLGAF